MTGDIPILGPPLVDVARATTIIIAHHTQHTYPNAEIRIIVNSYAFTCPFAGVSLAVALAQLCHETGWLQSWWSAPPRRNPAGIGVTGAVYATKPAKPPSALHPDGKWHAGISFDNWAPESVDAHCGRLAAYALPVGAENQEQSRLIAIAGRWRPIPARLRGVATTIGGLGGIWAVGPHEKLYGPALARTVDLLLA